MIIGILSSFVVHRWQGGSLSLSRNTLAAAVYSQYIVSLCSVLIWGQDTTVGIVTSYRLDGWRLEFQQGQDTFIFSKTVQTGSGAHPAAYPKGFGVLSKLQSSTGISI
jgi:hypothetical protein